MKLSPLLFISISILLVNCDPRNDHCNSTDPAPPSTAFMLIDSTTGEPLIGQNKAYDPDSVNSLNTYPPFHIDENQDTVVTFFFGGVASGVKLLFSLSETEVDTIQIEYIVRQTECYDFKELIRFYYNDELIEPDNGSYVIEK